jgi:uncharacterized protein (DUF433 family)
MIIDGLATTQTAAPLPNPDSAGRIVRSSDVCCGEARVAGTRLSVWGLEEWRRLGWDDEDLFAAYPTLSREDLEAARDYAVSHREEIEEAIRANREA